MYAIQGLMNMGDFDFLMKVDSRPMIDDLYCEYYGSRDTKINYFVSIFLNCITYTTQNTLKAILQHPKCDPAILNANNLPDCFLGQKLGPQRYIHEIKILKSSLDFVCFPLN